MNKFLLTSLMPFFLVGCSYNVSMSHSEGHAEDIIDSEQSADPETDINLDGENPVV